MLSELCIILTCALWLVKSYSNHPSCIYKRNQVIFQILVDFRVEHYFNIGVKHYEQSIFSKTGNLWISIFSNFSSILLIFMKKPNRLDGYENKIIAPSGQLCTTYKTQQTFQYPVHQYPNIPLILNHQPTNHKTRT